MPTRAPRRSGVVIGWVGAMLALLAVVATGIWFATTGSRANVARALAARTYTDLCLSALAEARAQLVAAVDEEKPLQGFRVEEALGKDYPFTPFEIQPAVTRKLATRLHPGVNVGPVRVQPGDRTPAGWADPLQGTFSLTVSVDGHLGGVASGREMTHLIAFSVPCLLSTVESPFAIDIGVQFGVPFLVLDPIAVRTRRF